MKFKRREFNGDICDLIAIFTLFIGFSQKNLEIQYTQKKSVAF